MTHRTALIRPALAAGLVAAAFALVPANGSSAPVAAPSASAASASATASLDASLASGPAHAPIALGPSVHY
jgi:hypothetical protein